MDENESAESDSAPVAFTIADAHKQLSKFIEEVREYCVFMLDPDARVVIWNSGAEYILGYTKEEMLGENAMRIFTPEDRARSVPEQELRTAAETGRAEDERWHQRKDGSRFWASGLMMSVRDDSGNLRGFCKMLRDLTERHNAEEARLAAHQKDRRIADALQRSMIVPLEEHTFRGITVGSCHEAAWEEAQVGGDFFDAFLLGNNRVALAVGDASGKGLAAAVRTTQVKDTLRAFLRTSGDFDASKTVSRLNDYLCESKRLDASANAEIDDTSESFVALSLVIVDTTTGQATFAIAGAEPPLVLRADGSVESVEIPGLPLGVLPQQDYPSKMIRLNPSDAILLLTDGVTEARQGREFLASEDLRAIASTAISSQSTSDAAKTILGAAKAFAGGKLQDDACLLLMRRL